MVAAPFGLSGLPLYSSGSTAVVDAVESRPSRLSSEQKGGRAVVGADDPFCAYVDSLCRV